MSEQTITEPVFLAQTFDADHTSTKDAVWAWLHARAREAQAKGVTFARLSWTEKCDGLLYEGWTEQPPEQGEPRWMMAAMQPQGGVQ